MNRSLFSVLVASSLLAVACSAPSEDAVDNGGGSIVGGHEAAEGAWPGTAALFVGSRAICGGTLIAPQWILTAAHCVDPGHPTGGINQAVLGRHDLTKTTAGEAIAIDRVVAHDGFNQEMNNDLALLHLAKPASAKPVRLVGATDLASLAPGSDVTVVGWGDTSEYGNSSDVLRQVTVPVVSNDACAASYATMGAKIIDSMLCAGLPEGTKDSCQGDSGGPLYKTVGDEAVIVGIVSWGEGCARPDRPGVYTRVSSHLEWIAKSMTAAR